VSKHHTEHPEEPTAESHEHSDPQADPKEKHESIIQPIIDDLKNQTTAVLPSEDEVAPPRGPLHPPQPARLDQDPGGGYNPDNTYPQT